MRIAILSDIHSNIQALTKAFERIDSLDIDAVYCLGDIVGYGGNPNECADLIRSRASKCVMGNHDLAALDIGEAEYFTKPGKKAAEWTNKVLSRENAEYLSRLPYKIELEDLTLVHANPAAPEHWEYVNSLETAKSQFSHFTNSLCFIGHSHMPFLCSEDLSTFTLRKGLRALVNVGSVGQPRDGNPELSFGLLDTVQWTYENVRSEYDISGAAKSILDNGLPQFLAARLFKGQ